MSLHDICHLLFTLHTCKPQMIAGQATDEACLLGGLITQRYLGVATYWYRYIAMLCSKP